jgi:hypothetical protein
MKALTLVGKNVLRSGLITNDQLLEQMAHFQQME